MTSTAMRLVNVVIIALTSVAVVLILDVGRTSPVTSLELSVGRLSPQDFVANRATGPIVDYESTEVVREAARASVATVYRADGTVDSVATVAAREAAAIAVEPVLVRYGFGDLIAEAGEPISSAQFAAITQLGLHEQSTARVFGWPVVITGLVAVGLALTWYRVTGDQLQPRHLALLAAVFVLSATLVRAINSIPN